MNIVFYHNPRCSKSRAVHELLTERELTYELVEYLKNPLSKSDLNRVIDALDDAPQVLVRSGDAAFKELNLDLGSMDRDQIIDLLMSTPALLQRPIVMVDGRARIGRPIDQVEGILP